jgi:hypothetical protein
MRKASPDSVSLDRFLEAMARAFGTSKKELESILFQGQKERVKQKRRSPRPPIIKQSNLQSSSP